jgi:hypothetical protein
LFLTKERLRLYLGGLLLLQLLACARLFPSVRAGAIDFRTFYTTGHMLRTGNAIYDYEAEKSAQSNCCRSVRLFRRGTHSYPAVRVGFSIAALRNAGCPIFATASLSLTWDILQAAVRS